MSRNLCYYDYDYVLQGKSYCFKQVLKAMTLPVGGRRFFLIFEASDHVGTGAFQAKVFLKIPDPSNETYCQEKFPLVLLLVSVCICLFNWCYPECPRYWIYGFGFLWCLWILTLSSPRLVRDTCALQVQKFEQEGQASVFRQAFTKATL